jgi:hypothetical protein
LGSDFTTPQLYYNLRGEANMRNSKGLRDIPTMKHVEQAQFRSPDQVFNKGVQLNREKMRLYKERIFWLEKIKQIDERLIQIEELQKVVHRKMTAQEEALKQHIAHDMMPQKNVSTGQDMQQTTQDRGEEKTHNKTVLRY